jgi:hypothetical protein
VGTWGTGLFADDLAADLRGDLRDLIAQGLASDEAVDRLTIDYASSIEDSEEAAVFWIAVAYAAWRLGRPSTRATTTALQIIENGADLSRWTDEKDRRQRQAVLGRVKRDLELAAPAPRHIRAPIIVNNQWAAGDIVAYRLASGFWTPFRVIGHHIDKGGRFAIYEPLDWVGLNLPVSSDMTDLPVRRSIPPWDASQFLLEEPRRKQDLERIRHTGINSPPTQHPANFFGFIFRRLDDSLEQIFGLR